MKRNFHYFILPIALIMLTGCETVKYTFNQSFGDQREFGTFQTKSDENKNSDLLLANADDWVKKHLW